MRFWYYIRDGDHIATSMGRFENMSTLVKSYTGLTKAGFQDVGGLTPFSQGTAVENSGPQMVVAKGCWLDVP